MNYAADRKAQSNITVENQAARAGVTITVTYPDGRSATGTFDKVRKFDASTPKVLMYDSRLQAYVYHLLQQATDVQV